MPFTTKLFILKELDILGSRNATPPELQAVAAMLAEGVFPKEALVSHVVPLEEAGRALERWNDDPAKVTKIQVEVESAGE